MIYHNRDIAITLLVRIHVVYHNLDMQKLWPEVIHIHHTIPLRIEPSTLPRLLGPTHVHFYA